MDTDTDTARARAGAPAGVLTAALPVGLAIGVFGVLYGAAARPLLGAGPAVASSVIIFSGAAQFTMVGLLAAGAAPTTVLAGAATLALRHLPLGAVLRPRITAPVRRRVLLSWFLLDETTGLALAGRAPVERTLAVTGAVAYAGWVLGTVAGVAGASLADLQPLADALFPVLFVGLAALTARGRGDRRRTLVAGAVTLLVLLVWPTAGALTAMGVALLVALLVRSP